MMGLKKESFSTVKIISFFVRRFYMVIFIVWNVIKYLYNKAWCKPQGFKSETFYAFIITSFFCMWKSNLISKTISFHYIDTSYILKSAIENASYISTESEVVIIFKVEVTWVLSYVNFLLGVIKSPWSGERWHNFPFGQIEYRIFFLFDQSDYSDLVCHSRVIVWFIRDNLHSSWPAWRGVLFEKYFLMILFIAFVRKLCRMILKTFYIVTQNFQNPKEKEIQRSQW